jgi:hypothetical protein
METAVVHWVNAVKARAEQAGVFADVTVNEGNLYCAARDSAADASYRIVRDGDQWFVSLVTSDRWLSESIEADLMHHGDPMEELIEEELVELGHTPKPFKVQHFRSDDLLYTFRNPLPLAGIEPSAAADLAFTWLLAYEAAFRRLGDMEAGESDE